MKRLSFVLALVLILPTLAHADDASKRAKVEEMIRITKMDQMMSQMMDQMAERMKAMTSKQTANLNMSADQRKIFDNYQAHIHQIMADSISWDKMKPLIINVYSETYTDEELDGILAFYRTPAGQALIAKSPQLVAKTMDLVQKQMLDTQPKIQQATEDFTHQMKQLDSTTPAKP
jgi:uncharacterized protein